MKLKKVLKKLNKAGFEVLTLTLNPHNDHAPLLWHKAIKGQHAIDFYSDNGIVLIASS